MELRKRRITPRYGDSVTLDAALNIIERCRHIILFTGSGISAASGMSMFSTRNGLYERARKKFKVQDGIKLFTYSFYRQRRAEVQAFFAQIYSEAQASQAATGHHAMAELLQLGALRRHYTLNIDGLSEVVGMDTWHHERNPHGSTVEMHGNIRQLVCPSCHAVEPLSRQNICLMRNQNPVPCSACKQDQLRFKVMLYDDGEGDCITPEHVFDVLEEDLKACDMIVWAGISFQQSASVEYFRRVRHTLGTLGRLNAVPQVLVNPSEEPYFNLLSALSNPNELQLLDLRETSDVAFPAMAQRLRDAIQREEAQERAEAEAAALAGSAGLGVPGSTIDERGFAGAVEGFGSFGRLLAPGFGTVTGSLQGFGAAVQQPIAAAARQLGGNGCGVTEAPLRLGAVAGLGEGAAAAASLGAQAVLAMIMPESAGAGIPWVKVEAAEAPELFCKVEPGPDRPYGRNGSSGGGCGYMPGGDAGGIGHDAYGAPQAQPQALYGQGGESEAALTPDTGPGVKSLHLPLTRAIPSRRGGSAQTSAGSSSGGGAGGEGTEEQEGWEAAAALADDASDEDYREGEDEDEGRCRRSGRGQGRGRGGGRGRGRGGRGGRGRGGANGSRPPSLGGAGDGPEAVAAATAAEALGPSGCRQVLSPLGLLRGLTPGVLPAVTSTEQHPVLQLAPSGLQLAISPLTQPPDLQVPQQVPQQAPQQGLSQSPSQLLQQLQQLQQLQVLAQLRQQQGQQQGQPEPLALPQQLLSILRGQQSALQQPLEQPTQQQQLHVLGPQQQVQAGGPDALQQLQALAAQKQLEQRPQQQAQQQPSVLDVLQQLQSLTKAQMARR